VPQYVRVKYPRNRYVEVDDAVCGLTNDVLMVEEGMHRFNLGEPVNYVPPFIEENVTGTSRRRPLEIEFAFDDDDARIPIKRGRE
jgi:hypothetical protein